MSTQRDQYHLEERSTTDLSHVDFTPEDRQTLTNKPGISIDATNSVTVSHYIGTIGLPSGKYLEIQPKDTLSGFKPLYYLAKANRINETLVTGAHDIGFTPGDSFIDIMAMVFEAELQRLLRKGLHQEYVTRTASTQYVRGQLRMTDQLAAQEPLPTAFESRYEEQTADLPLNQLLRVTLQEFATRVTTQALADRLRQRFEQLGQRVSCPATPPHPRQIRLTQETQAYRPLIQLSEQLLNESYLDTFGHRGEVLDSVVMSTETLFEQVVFNAMAAVTHTSRYRTGGDGDPTNTATNSIGNLLKTTQGEDVRELRPDIFLHASGQPQLIADAKWQERESPRRGDLYQLTTYQRHVAAPALIFYPEQSNDIEQQYELQGGSHQDVWTGALDIIELPLGADTYEAFEDQLHATIRSALSQHLDDF